ncbi:hypothetical protein ACFY1P_21100 [Streptomyces sp. NPDC001407]|uniref:hypothetical protein n=1 Tax=unclassified Streptomyces TaxID=2593676 RepID=UPI00367C0F6E
MTEENAARLSIEARGELRAVHGSQFNYPSVVVRNIGTEWIGTVRITVENLRKSRMAFMDPQLTMARWEHEGTPQEEILAGVVTPGQDSDNETLTCESVALNLDCKPGQWVVLYPRMSAYAGGRQKPPGILDFTISTGDGAERLGGERVFVYID